MKAHMLHFVRFFTLVLIVGLTTGVAAQSNQYQHEIRLQLEYIRAQAEEISQYNLTSTHQIMYVQLSNNTYKDIQYHLDAGKTYAFLGACDFDCSGLQLKLYDSEGLVSSSYKDIPMVFASVTSSGKVWVRVTMKDCKTDYCWAGVAAYR